VRAHQRVYARLRRAMRAPGAPAWMVRMAPAALPWRARWFCPRTAAPYRPLRTCNL